MNKTINKLIPKLRFPEFVKDGEWVEKSLNDFCFNISSGKDKNQNDGEFELYGSTGIIGKTENASYDGAYILVARVGANAGLLNKANGKFGVTDNTLVVNLKEPEKIDFMFYTLDNIGLNKLVFGSGQPLVTGKQLKELVIHVPENPQEQQKIASCLSSLDDLIAAHKDKLQALKDHKKGLMQNLYPQQGQKVPNYRFPEFEGDGEWEQKALKDVFSIFQGYAFSSKDSVSTGTRWLKIADVGIQEMKHDTPSYLPENFKDEFQRFLLKKGDYVLALTRPILGRKLKIAPVDETFHNALLNQRVGKLVTSNVISFVYYLMQTSSMVESIIRNIAGNEPPNLSFQQISDIVTFIPKEKTEQQKIASCLSALDELIQAQTEKIEQLQQHKKGLMQGLFPKVKE